MHVEMRLRGLALDPLCNLPIVILRSAEDDRVLPIWVGPFEAQAIAAGLERFSTPRPLTHDLLKDIIDSLAARVTKVVVNGLEENTFLAVIYLQIGDSEITLDSRPSDAIALALRAGAPMFVHEDIVRRVGMVESSDELDAAEPDETDGLRDWLENVRPEDFGESN